MSFIVELAVAYGVFWAILAVLGIIVFIFANENSLPTRAVAGFKQYLIEENLECAYFSSLYEDAESPESQEFERLAGSALGRHFA